MIELKGKKRHHCGLVTIVKTQNINRNTISQANSGMWINNCKAYIPLRCQIPRFALGNTPNTQFCVGNTNAKICVTSDAQPQYRLRWVPNAKLSCWPYTFNLFWCRFHSCWVPFFSGIWVYDCYCPMLLSTTSNPICSQGNLYRSNIF